MLPFQVCPPTLGSLDWLTNMGGTQTDHVEICQAANKIEYLQNTILDVLHCCFCLLCYCDVSYQT